MGESQATTQDAVIELQDVTKIYQMGKTRVAALAGVSLHFQRGSFWAIMGPSGSGKSTMLNLLGTLDRPTEGTYLLQGHDVADMTDNELSELRLRELGFIFQSFHLIPQLTVQENIELPLYYLGWDHDVSARRAEELADMVDLADRLDHRPMELSGGQRQRVAIARALATNANILLADEPTGNLDTKTGHQIMDLLRSLYERGKTVIMVTHEPDIAEFAQYQLHMRDGKIHQINGGGS